MVTGSDDDDDASEGKGAEAGASCVDAPGMAKTSDTGVDGLALPIADLSAAITPCCVLSDTSLPATDTTPAPTGTRPSSRVPGPIRLTHTRQPWERYPAMLDEVSVAPTLGAVASIVMVWARRSASEAAAVSVAVGANALVDAPPS